MTAHRGQALEVLNRLLASRLTAGAKLGTEELLEQRNLAVRRGTKDAQVAARDAELRQLRRGADDLEVGLVVRGAPLAAVGRDDAELL